MRRRCIKRLVIVLLCVGVIIPPAGDKADAWFRDQSAQEAQRHGLGAGTHNSIKHAFAAGVTYSWLRRVGIGDETAAAATVFLGQCNEYVEYATRSRIRRDPTEEIIKDYYNNQVGIEAARWAARQDKPVALNELLSLIGRLAADGALMLSREEITLETQQRVADLSEAQRWLDENQQKLTEESWRYLENR